MNEFFPDRAAVLAKAARLVESAGLTVLDRDCQAGGHRPGSAPRIGLSGN